MDSQTHGGKATTGAWGAVNVEVVVGGGALADGAYRGDRFFKCINKISWKYTQPPSKNQRCVYWITEVWNREHPWCRPVNN